MASSLTRRHSAGTPGYSFAILLTVVGFRCACLVPAQHARFKGPSSIPSQSLGPLFFEGEALTGRLPYRELSSPPRRLTPHPQVTSTRGASGVRVHFFIVKAVVVCPRGLECSTSMLRPGASPPLH